MSDIDISVTVNLTVDQIEEAIKEYLLRKGFSTVKCSFTIGTRYSGYGDQYGYSDLTGAKVDVKHSDKPKPPPSRTIKEHRYEDDYDDLK